MKSRLRTVAGALSEQTLGPRAAVLVLGHEQPVPIFQQLARGHPSGRDEYVRYPLVIRQVSVLIKLILVPICDWL
jgi:hypothetical protein